MRVPIQKQLDLDTAIHLVDQNDKISSLRLVITMPAENAGKYRKPPSLDSGIGSQRGSDLGAQVLAIATTTKFNCCESFILVS